MADDVTPEAIVGDLKSPELAAKMRAVCAARSALCVENPPVTPLVQAGIIPPLVQALHQDNWSDLQYRALGVLSNVAFGSFGHTSAVVNSGAVSKIITFLDYDVDMSERAILILGSLALGGGGAGRAARVATTRMLRDIRATTPLRLLRTLVRTYSNMCSYQADYEDDNKTRLELVSPALPYLYEVLDIENEESLDLEDKETPFIARDIVVDACVALANIMLGPAECTDAVQAVSGLTTRLVDLLQHGAANVRAAALTAVGNMLGGTDTQVYRCLEANCLEHISFLLRCKSGPLVHEAVRAAANILAGTRGQIQQALDKDILAALLNLLDKGDPLCQKQVLYAVDCLCQQGSAAQRSQLISSQDLKSFCAILASPDPSLVKDVLNGLDVLIQVEERDGNIERLCYVLDELEVFDDLQHLHKHHHHEDTHYKIANICDTIRQHAREERCAVYDDEVFTSERIVQDLISEHHETHSRAVGATYRLMREDNPPINGFLECGILTPLVRAMDRNSCPSLLYLAARMLFVITAGTRKHKMAAVHGGAIPKLVSVLACGEEIAYKASCSLGDLALHGAETKNAVMAYASTEMGLTELRFFMAIYKKFCGQVCQSLVKHDRLLRPLPFVTQLMDIGDTEILRDACQSCWFLMGSPGDSSVEAMQSVQAVPGLTARLVALLSHGADDVQKTAWAAVGNMLCGTDEQVDRCIESGCLDHITTLLRSPKPHVVEEAARAIRNILYHTPTHIQLALDKDILTPLRDVLAKGDAQSQEQAVRGITNICLKGSTAQRELLVTSSALAAYCSLLTRAPLDTAASVLDGIYLLLRSGRYNMVIDGIDDKMKHDLQEELVEEVVEKDGKLDVVCSKLDSIGVVDLLRQLEARDIDKEMRLKVVIVTSILRQRIREENLVIPDGKVALTLDETVQDLKSSDVRKQIRAVTAISRLSCAHCTPGPDVDAVVKAGVIPLLVALLARKDCSELHFEVATAFTKIAVTGSHKHRVAIVDNGAIPKLVELVRQGGSAAEPATWTLGEMTRRAPMSRDLVLKNGAVRAFLPYLRPDTSLELLKSCVRTLWILCTDMVSDSMFKLVAPALPYISELLIVEDQVVLKRACGVLINVLMGLDGHGAERVLPRVTVPRLVGLLAHEATDVQEAALKVISSMLCWTDTHEDRLLEAGCLDHIVKFLTCGEPSLVETAAAAARNLLGGTATHVETAVKAGILPPLLNILTFAEPNSFLQYYVVCALLNVTVHNEPPEYILTVIEGGAVPKLVELLFLIAVVAEKAAITLGNIAVLGPGSRDLVLAHGAVPAMIPRMLPATDVDLLRACVRTYMQFCFGVDSTPTFELLSPALPLISGLLVNEDLKVLEHACEALANILCGPDERREAVQQVPGLTPRLIALLEHETTEVKGKALAAMVNMMCGTELQVNRCLEAGCVRPIVSLLQSSDPSLVRSAVLGTYNLMRHSHAQIQRALDEGILPPVLHMLTDSKKDNSSLQYYAVSALSHIIAKGTQKQKMVVVNSGAIPRLVGLMPQGGATGVVAAKILGCLTEVDQETRDQVLAVGTLPAMLPHLRANAEPEMLTSCLILYQNICGVEFALAPIDLVSPALPYISDLLDVENFEVLKSACNVISHLASLSVEYIESVQTTSGLVTRLVSLLAHKIAAVQEIAIKAVANMLNGTAAQAGRCLDAGCLDSIASLLLSRAPALIEIAALATCNALRHSHVHVQRVLESGAVALLLDTLTDVEPNSLHRRYVAAAVSNIMAGGLYEHKKAVAEIGAISKLIYLLTYEDEASEYAARSIMNFAGSEPEARDLAVGQGAVTAILPHLRPDAPLKLLTSCIGAYRNLCSQDEEPTKHLDLLSSALPRVSELLGAEDVIVLEHASFALIGLSKTHDGIEAVQAVAGLTARIVQLLRNDTVAVRIAAANVLRNMLAGTEAQVGECLKAGYVEYIVQVLQSRQPNAALELALLTLNNIMCHSLVIQQTFEKGILTLLLDVINEAIPYCRVQHLALTALTTLAMNGTSEQRMALIDGGALPKLIVLLHRGGIQSILSAMTLWIVAGDSLAATDLVLHHGAVPAMLPHLHPNTPTNPLSIFVKTYRCLCKQIEEDPTERIKILTPALPRMSDLLGLKDPLVLEHACWALVSLSKTHEGVEAVQATPGLTKQLGALLQHEATTIPSVAIVAVMLMLSGTDEQVERCLEAGFVEDLVSYLRRRDPDVIKEAGEVLKSTLDARHSRTHNDDDHTHHDYPHTEQALEQGWLTPLITVLKCPSKGQRRTVRAISNLYRLATAAQRDQLVSSGVLGPYCALLAGTELTLILDVLNSLAELLQTGAKDGNWRLLCSKLNDMGVFEQVGKLRNHNDKEITTKVNHLIDTYFSRNL